MGCRAARTPAAAENAAQAAKRTSLQRPALQAPAPATPPESPWFPPQDWSERRAPEDFRIGSLDWGVVDEAAYRTLEAVCEALVLGRVEANALDPARAAGLSEALSGQMERGGRPRDYRIGRLQPVSDAAVSARVRFFGERGSVEGEAYLVRLPEGWFVSDLQIDLSMAKPGPEKPETFLPSPYRGTTD